MSFRNSREEEEESSDDGRRSRPARQTFVDSEGYPLCFFIHKSIRKLGAREKLTSDIESHGGSVVGTDGNADIVIIDDARTDRDVQQLSYDVHVDKSMRHIYVEPMPFIQRCIRQGTVRHRVKERQGMGGVVGRTRAPFTEDDDLNLCRYLALRIPRKEAGGRSGDNVYKELEKLAAHQPAQYNWVQRHTWQSLRERYKKKAVYFDKLIDNFVKAEQPTAKQHYFRDRTWRRGRPKALDFDGGHREGDENQVEEIFESESELESDDENGRAPSHDELQVNNAPTIQGKRRRSENHRDSLPSASPTKRQRIEQRSQTTSTHSQIISSDQVKGKGKHRAQPHLDDESDDQPHQRSSLFSEDEDMAGPSGTQHTPLASPALAPNFSKSPFLTQPQTSQATLVPTPTPHDPQHKLSNRLDQVGTSLQAKPLILANEPIDAPPTGHIKQARVRRGRQPPGPSIKLLPPVERPPEDPPAPVKTIPPRPLRFAKKKAAALGSTSIAPPVIPDPPSRNTRSRSRSVEPSSTSTQLPLLIKNSRKRKAKETISSHLQPLEEVEEESNEMLDMPVTSLLAAQSGEVVEEEKDVEEFLITNATETSGASQYREGIDPQTSNSKERDLSTDDEQSDKILRRNYGLPRPQFPTSDIVVEARTGDILKRLEARSAPSHRSSAHPPFIIRSDLTRTSVEGLASSRTSRSIADPIPQPSTPVRSRKRSTSSTESFPLVGTKASAMKRKIVEEEKNNPYTPPPGTRAARYKR